MSLIDSLCTSQGPSVCRSPSPNTVIDGEEENAYPLGLPESLVKILPLVTKSQRELMIALCSADCDQAHLFDHWPKADEVDVGPVFKRRFIEQLEEIDNSYPDGLVGYIKKARALLDEKSKGVNPLEGWTPLVPQGETFEVGTEDYSDVERLGLRELNSVGFVLVAGGLGERLGCSGTKLGLPTELATQTTYLQHYIESILGIEQRYGEGNKLPLCIMTSNETHEGIMDLLTDNKYFGMKKEQVTIVKQGEGVPALVNNDAKMTIDPENEFRILTQPHGHGDIHALLHKHGVAWKWKNRGIQWIMFLQDNNALAFHTLPLLLGSSVKNSFVLNWLGIPRESKHALGGIAKLVHAETKETRTFNVEYNQLVQYEQLKSLVCEKPKSSEEFDVMKKLAEETPFPGNTNQFVYQLDAYLANLERTKASMPEFVNPEYTNESKTEFAKPARLECRMQDFAGVLQGREAMKVGVTTVPASLCFSPMMNAASAMHGCAATAEADQYAVHRTIMRSIGCHVEEAAPQTFNGVTIVPGPQVILKPNVACFPCEYRNVFPDPDKIKIFDRSSLVVSGTDIKIKSLDLEGALVVTGQGKVGYLNIRNVGWLVEEDKDDKTPMIAVRGYKLKKKDTECIVLEDDRMSKPTRVVEEMSGCIIS